MGMLSDIFPGPDASSSATSHAERLRGVMSWALMGAGVVCTGGAAAMVLIIWLGEWTPAMESQRLSYMGYALLGMLGGIGAVIISLAIGGPVGRWKATVAGASFEAEGDAKVQTITSTTVTSPPQE